MTRTDDDYRALNDQLNASEESEPEGPAKTATRWVFAAAVVVVLMLVSGMAFGAFTLFAGAAVQAGDNRAELLAAAEPRLQAERRIDNAEDQIAELPSTQQARRWIAQAVEDSAKVAEIQNTYLTETGPLTLEGVPTVNPNPEMGQRDPNYTVEQRYEVAGEMRRDKVNGLLNQLVPRFGADVGPTGFNPVGAWQSQIPETAALEADPAVTLSEGYTWVASVPAIFDSNGHLLLSWELRAIEDDSLVAVVTSTYDADRSRSSDPVLTVIDREEDR